MSRNKDVSPLSLHFFTGLLERVDDIFEGLGVFAQQRAHVAIVLSENDETEREMLGQKAAAVGAPRREIEEPERIAVEPALILSVVGMEHDRVVALERRLFAARQHALADLVRAGRRRLTSRVEYPAALEHLP